MRVTVDAPFGEMRWIMLEIPGARTQLRLETVMQMPDGSGPTLSVIASDVVEMAERLRGASVEIVSDPKPAEWNADITYALVRDSKGNTVLLATG